MSNEVKWEGADALREHLVPLADLKRAPRNPRLGDVPFIAESLQTFGQQKPIVVAKGEVLAGNHTCDGCEMIHWTHVSAIETSVTPEQREAYLLADNMASDRATYDDDILADILGDLQERGQLEIAGWTMDELDDLIASNDAIPLTEPEPFEGGHAETPDQLAARSARRSLGESRREVILLLTPEEHGRFANYIRILRVARSLEGTAEITFNAVAHAALAYWPDEDVTDDPLAEHVIEQQIKS